MVRYAFHLNLLVLPLALALPFELISITIHLFRAEGKNAKARFLDRFE